MNRVIIESPYAGRSRWRLLAFFQRIGNRRFARRCVRDSLMRGEAPLASHLLYTQRGILRDEVMEERKQGIAAGLTWLRHAKLSAVYVDRGISSGMRYGIAAAEGLGVLVRYRALDPDAGLLFLADNPLLDVEPCVELGSPEWHRFWQLAAEIREANREKSYAANPSLRRRAEQLRANAITSASIMPAAKP